MNRISKISKLLKLCAESDDGDIWAAILKEVNDEEVDYSKYPEMRVLLDSAEDAAKIKQEAEKVVDDVKSFSKEDLAMLRELGKDPSIAKELLSQSKSASLEDLIFVKIASKYFTKSESEAILQEIYRFAWRKTPLVKDASLVPDKVYWLKKLCSDTAAFKNTELYDISLKYSDQPLMKSSGVVDSAKGLAGSLFGKVKGLFGVAFKFLPIIGVFWSMYEAYHDWNKLSAASAAIKANFVALGDEGSLFKPEYIKSLVIINKDAPERLLEVTKLNKLAAFYHKHFLSIWYDAAWFVADLIASIALVGSGGIFGAAAGLVAAIGSVAGIGSAIGMIGTEFFNLGMSEFKENSLMIKGIAEKHTAGIAESNPGERKELDEQNKEFETRRLFS